jgi:hypothetical protein
VRSAALVEGRATPDSLLKRITLPRPAEVEATIVGVVANVKQLSLSAADEPQLYVGRSRAASD